MEKTKVIVDTCFLQKLSSEGKNTSNIKLVLDELNYSPVTHPYVVEQELKLHSSLEALVKEGYIESIPYESFLRTDSERKLYESYFSVLYEELREYREAIGGPKQMSALKLSGTQTIYNVHMQGSSMADVHMVLMAAFLKLPIVLTEDSDIELLRKIAKKRISVGGYSLQIYNAVDLIEHIAQKPDSTISKKEIERLLNEMRERGVRARITKVWNESHEKV